MTDQSLTRSHAIRSVLSSLGEYTHYLHSLSLRCYDELKKENGKFNLEYCQDFSKLVEGINEFTKAADEVKGAVLAHSDSKVHLIEADLLSILEDVLTSHQNHDQNYLLELLQTHLPKNLQDWREFALPALVQRLSPPEEQSLGSVQTQP